LPFGAGGFYWMMSNLSRAKRHYNRALLENTVTASMARQHLVARPGPRRRRNLIRPDRRVRVIIDPIHREFDPTEIDTTGCGDRPRFRPTRASCIWAP
jgi:hypothetical protein